MKSARRGKLTSAVEVAHVPKHGFWLLLDERERFVGFERFPWFRDVSIGQLRNVELPHPHRLYWPDLDVDVAVESIDHAERFPLVSHARPDRCVQPARKRRARGRCAYCSAWPSEETGNEAHVYRVMGRCRRFAERQRRSANVWRARVATWL